MSKFAKCVCLINSLLKGNQSYFLPRVCCIFHEVNFSNSAHSCVWYCRILRRIFSCCSAHSAVFGLGPRVVTGSNNQKPLFCRRIICSSLARWEPQRVFLPSKERCFCETKIWCWRWSERSYKMKLLYRTLFWRDILHQYNWEAYLAENN